MIFYILFVCCFPHRHCGGTASPLRSLYTITEKGGEHEKRADGKEAGADKHHDGLAYVVVAPVHLDVNLERGYDNHSGRFSGQPLETIALYISSDVKGSDR